MTNYPEQIRELIQKQQELWNEYNRTKPTADMLPGEKKKRLAKCHDIYQEIVSARYEVHKLDREWKENRARSVYNVSPGVKGDDHGVQA
ncbi:hypothetical protein KO561_12920 [Radiobacillus kanasensis]|uniref:hypothetical protein n=1 Tax=Radiobacillus kanasensis TaxID=2844358 RepID=UPI001E5E5917|nr:hypothetical protein [Radiobacillus kanasensis]UFT98104.1 hypothetical protein KO561_12920 [Radiobacillus kanasensis]